MAKLAYGYARFSSDNQREESIDAQKRAIIYYAGHEGYEIVRWYEDKAKSAKTANRPGFLQMMEDIKEKQVEAVLVHKLDRFSRNIADTHNYSADLKDNGVDLVSVMERLDDSPTGELMKSIITAINAFYSRNLATETMKGLKENALKALTTGGIPPLGYDIVDKQYVINEREAEAVRLAFNMYDQGHGYLPIIRELRMRGYKTKAGRDFGKNSLYSIFHNEKYKGVYTFNKAQSRRRDGSRSGQQKAEDQFIRIPGGVPAIVDEEVWNRVNVMMEKRSKRQGAGKAKHLYLLSGLVFCGECGYSMCGNARKPSPSRDELVTYRCSHRHNKAACSNREIKKDVLENYVLTQLEQRLFDDKMIPSLTQQLNQYILNSNREADTLQGQRIARKVELEKQQKNIIEAISKTGFDDVFTQQLADIKQELEEIGKILANEKMMKAKQVVTEEMVRGYLWQMKQFVQERNLLQVKTFIHSYVERVEVYQTHVKVKLRLAIWEDQEPQAETFGFHVQSSRRQLRESTSA